MQITGRTLEAIRNRGQANHRAILGEQELQMQTNRIGRAAAEAAVLGGMRHGGQFFGR